MKNIRHITAHDKADNRLGISNHQVSVPKSKLSFGSVADKYPVSLDGGKTIIFISDKNKEPETRQRYELQIGNRYLQYTKKPRV